MKKFTMLSSVLASALMMTVVSCSSSDDITGGNGSGNAEGTTSYIAINLNSVGNAPTSRAYNQGEGTYDDGENKENNITKVRFYFYNVDGTSYKLQTAGENGEKSSKNYIDYNVNLGEGNHDTTVSGTTSAVLVLNGESNVAPASMLTVVNPGVNTEMLDGTTANRWSTMRTEMKGTKFYDETNGFIMSNSTYEDGGKDLCTTYLTGKTFSSADEATNNPVEVFVERVNAKVKTTVGGANFVQENTNVELDGVNFNGKYKTKDPVGKLTTIQSDGSSKETEVYAYIEGWGLGDENGQAMLYKQIDVQNWTDATLGFTATNPWSVAAYHRCFWGKSIAFGGTSTNSPVNYPYNHINAEFGKALYTLPNTPTSYGEEYADPMKSNFTKIMVAARLAYTDGGKVLPAEICTYKGQKFLGKDNVKKVIASELNSCYKKITSTTPGGEDTYTQIAASDIDFSSSASVQNYQVVAVLGLNELYQKKGGVFVKLEAQDLAKVKAEIQQVPVDISNGGRTYYYTPIKHLGKKNYPAEYGVVRNHSYQVEISSIKGFGTPVYDPDKVTIIPTLPSDDLTYLAAKISVLSWRVVSDKVNLDKTE
uniref:Mfa1 family fimbria major subunit n=1 Tax=Segatella hominis TaxID=2518605 RepID=UPI004038D259